MIDINSLKKKPTPKFGRIGVRTSEKLKKRLDIFCKEKKVSISTVLVALLKKYLDSEGY